VARGELLTRCEAAARAFRCAPITAGTYTETSQGEIRFPEISTKTLEKTIQYFYYKLKHTNNKEGSLPDFQIEPEHALELLMAANYLDA
jgi:transcription elongation factor B subunit 1